MKRRTTSTAMVVLFAMAMSSRVAAQTCASCPVVLDNHASQPLGTVTHTTGCVPKTHNGLPTPDPTCTPGAINPTVTLAVLKNAAFRTGCLRDCSTSSSQKGTTYANYGLTRPANNTGTTQTCELDHVVPLEIGGADTLDNIWPQCGPKNVAVLQTEGSGRELPRGQGEDRGH
jgi:hypothetical protein